MIKVRNDVFEIIQRATVVADLLSNKIVPIRISYKLLQLWKKVGQAQEVYLEAKKKIIDEFVEKDENNKPVIENNTFKIPEEKTEDFNRKMAELLFLETEIDTEKIKVRLDDLPEGIVSATDLSLLELFIEFEE
jgi:hypothetical protein